MGILPMNITGVPPVVFVFLLFLLSQYNDTTNGEDHGQDARDTHGRDAHAM
jgi:hypothetical protein